MTESLNAFLQEFDIDMTDTKSTFNLDEEGKPLSYGGNNRNYYYGGGRYRGNARKTFKYPNTEFLIKVSVTLSYTGSAQDTGGRGVYYPEIKGNIKENTLVAVATFSTSSSSLTLTEEQMADIQAEGELLDITEDIEEPKFKDSIPPSKVREEYLRQEAIKKAKELERLQKKKEKELEKEQLKLQKQLAKVNKLKTKTESNIS